MSDFVLSGIPVCTFIGLSLRNICALSRLSSEYLVFDYMFLISDDSFALLLHTYQVLSVAYMRFGTVILFNSGYSFFHVALKIFLVHSYMALT